jgi:hypothetical protein
MRFRPAGASGSFERKLLVGISGLILLYGAVSLVCAQTSQTPTSAEGSMNALEQINWSARAAIFGTSFTAVADDPSALFLNPAGLAFQPEASIALNSYLGWTGIFQETVLASIPLGPWGGVGLSGGYLGYGSFEGWDAMGSPAPNYSADIKNFDLGWGGSFSSSIAFGAAFHASEETLAGIGYFLWSPEVGVLLQPLAQISLGLDYAGAGGGTWTGSKVSTWKSGFSWKFPLDESVQVLSAFGFSAQSDSFDAAQVASEVSVEKSFFIRAGYGAPLQGNGDGGFSGLSLGAGLVLDDFQLDYAYLPGGELGDSNVFNLTYWFVPQPPSIPHQQVPGNSLTIKFNIPPDFIAQGKTMEAQGDFQKAALLYHQALAQDPQNVEGWDDLGKIDENLELLSDARDCFKKALQLSPADSVARQGLRDCPP